MVRTSGKQNKMVAILFLDHWKTELQTILYSNVFGIQAPPTLLEDFGEITSQCANHITQILIYKAEFCPNLHQF